MKHAVMVAIMETMREIYGSDYVELVDGKICVTNSESGTVCEIAVKSK